MKSLSLILRSVAAVVAGYALMVALITLVQEVWFGGVSYHTSSLPELALAGACTFLSAVAGGFVAAWIAGRAHWQHALVMSLLVVAETTLLLVTGRIGGPLWFDLSASASLIVGLLLGAQAFVWVKQRAMQRRPSSAGIA